MEKERLNYQAPTISQRKVVLQEVIAGSGYTPGVDPAIEPSATVKFTLSNMTLQEGADLGHNTAGSGNYFNSSEWEINNWE